MSEFGPDIAPAVIEACQAGAEQAAAALNKALGGEFTLSVGAVDTFGTSSAPDGFEGAGLALLLKTGETGAAVIIPESSGLLPDWISAPDESDTSKLNTLAQELGSLLLPEEFAAEVFEAAHVPACSTALTNAQVAVEAALLPLDVKQGDQTTQLSLIWPLKNPDALLAGQGDQETTGELAADTSHSFGSKAKTFSDLPAYSRSLLKVEVPVSVVLAAHRQNLKDIVELAPGTLLKFDKACDELLTLCVSDRPIAEGEAVKVGDKFGFRILSMVMPEEHFLKAQRDKAS